MKHKNYIEKYDGSLEHLAEDIGNLRYDALADLKRAHLDNANFTNADLRNADLKRAYLDNAIFCNTIMPDGSIRNDNY
ncbi:MAG: pentapeptide repeat-containing protein [Cyanobacteria bacterium J06629_18]